MVIATDWTSKIRDARPGDVPAIVALYADDPLGQTREQAADPLPAPYWTAFEAIHADPRHRLVVIDDGEVVGTLQLSFVPHLVRMGTERAQIEAVRVASHRRGEGLGRGGPSPTGVFAFGEPKYRRSGPTCVSPDLEDLLQDPMAVHLGRYSKQIRSQARTRAALAACEGAVPRVVSEQAWRPHALDRRLSPEQHEQVASYYLGGHSAGWVARRLGISRTGVLSLLRERGIEIRQPGADNPLKQEQREQILAMQAVGKSQRCVAQELGIDRRRVRQLVPDGWCLP